MRTHRPSAQPSDHPRPRPSLHPSGHGQLALSHVTKCYGDRVVLDDVTFTVRPGERVGVVGDNGSGKSTLLRLIAGREEPDDGVLTVRAPGGRAYLAQALRLPEGATVADAIDEALAELRALEAELAAAEAQLGDASSEELAAYGELRERFEARGGYEADLRVDIALHGLGLPSLDRSRRIGHLSGGERSRLALAATLAASPELLLLDEPTNDLDDQAVAWLEESLRTHWGTVVVVTHDRLFLENVTDTILEVDDDTHAVRRYGDGWAGYLTAKAAARARWEQEYEDWLTELDRQSRLAATAAAQLATVGKRVALSNGGSGAARPRATATGTSHKVRNANERLRRLREEPVPRPPEPLRFAHAALRAGGPLGDGSAGDGDGGAAGKGPGNGTGGGSGQGSGGGSGAEGGSGTGGGEEAVGLTGVVVGDRLHVPRLSLAPGGRLLVTGPNGAGKTTLLRVLATELRPDAGSVTVRWTGTCGYLRQEETVGSTGQTLLRAYADGRQGSPEEYEQELLSLGLFRPDSLTTPVEALSTGQRRRLGLARLVSRPVDLLLLDEPTNHLAPVLVEELERALDAYTGTLVVVSHDRRLRRSFRGARLELRAGRAAELQPA